MAKRFGPGRIRNAGYKFSDFFSIFFYVGMFYVGMSFPLCRNVVVPRCRGCAEREPLAGVALAVLPPGRSDGAALPELGALNHPPP